MWRILLLILISLIAMSSTAFSQIQDNSPQEKKAYIFAEMEKADDNTVKEKVEDFYIKLKKDSYSQGYIINYGTDTEVTKRERQIRDSMNFREQDSPRITFIRGENKGKLKTAFWIVPNGAEPPKT